MSHHDAWNDDNSGSAWGMVGIFTLIVAIGLVFAAVIYSQQPRTRNEQKRVAAILSTKEGQDAAKKYRASVEENYAGEWIVKDKAKDEDGQAVYLVEPPAGPHLREWMPLDLPAVAGDKITFTAHALIDNFVPNADGTLLDRRLCVRASFADPRTVATAN